MTKVQIIRFADGSINTVETVEQAGRDYAARIECDGAASLTLGFQANVARRLIDQSRIPASANELDI